VLCPQLAEHDPPHARAHLMDIPDAPTVIQNALCECRLAGVYVSTDAHIPNMGQGLQGKEGDKTGVRFQTDGAIGEERDIDGMSMRNLL